MNNITAMTELSKKLWNGTLNVCIVLSPGDSNQMTEQHEFYCTVRRNSYFPFYFDKVLRYFEPYLLVPGWVHSPEWWLEFEEVPLRWNYPVGLLYDTLAGLDPQRRKGDNNVWKLVIHHRNYPENYLLPINRPEILESHWKNQLKESCYVLHGSAKPVMLLSKQRSSDLWNSIANNDFDLFWDVIPQILPKTLDRFNHIPVRFHLPVSDKVIDVPVKPVEDSEHSHEITLGCVLHKALPEVFPSFRNNILAKPVLHGVTVPLQTPLVQLYREALYIDGFLHFSIFMMT